MFQLKTITECELTSFVGRTQREGKDDIPAVSFRLALAGVTPKGGRRGRKPGAEVH